ncbi:hypothetical protein PM082_005611 [Marasmius tenuissimus]|nr:hypothetical protein PM082_005611 [Marasmius tenuissimus]
MGLKASNPRRPSIRPSSASFLDISHTPAASLIYIYHLVDWARRSPSLTAPSTTSCLPAMSLKLVDDSDYDIGISYLTQDGDNNHWTTTNKMCTKSYSGTCHTTTRDGARMQLHFEGTFIQVVGMILPMTAPNTVSNITIGYTLDSSTGTFDLPPPTSPPTPGLVLYQPDRLLENKNHDLALTLWPGNDYAVMVDYLAIQTSDFNPLPSITTTSVCLPPETETSSTSSSQSGGVNVGAVVGGVIAALVVLAALVLFVLHWRRRQRRADARHSITPFHIAPSEKPSSPPPTTPPPITPPSTTPALATLQPPPLVTVTHTQPTSSEFSPTSLPPPSFSLSSPTIEDEPPPPFVAGTSSDVVRHPSMYKPRSMESLPPTEYGYGGGLMLPTWRRNQDRHQPS